MNKWSDARRWGGLILTALVSFGLHAGEGKLIATAGTTQLEGTAGGGIVPWAVLSGYDTQEEISASVFSTRVGVDDYHLDAFGAALSLYDRVEISAAHHTFDLTGIGGEIQQNVYGVKLKLYGDVIYSAWPQLSVGIQYKDLKDNAIAYAVGAKEDSGTDFYLAATKVELGAVAGYNLLWNVSARASKANQLGLLGFGGDDNNSYDMLLEGSLALLLSQRLAVGIEYRQKSDNLGALKEDDWADVFVAWFPNKHVNLTLAWADLGEIAGARQQQGLYMSLTGYMW